MTNRGRSIKGLIKSQRQRHHKDYQGEQSHEKNCKRVTAIICIGREPNVIALHTGVTGLPQRESPLVRKMLEEKTIPVNKRQSPESKALCIMLSLAQRESPLVRKMLENKTLPVNKRLCAACSVWPMRSQPSLVLFLSILMLFVFILSPAS